MQPQNPGGGPTWSNKYTEKEKEKKHFYGDKETALMLEDSVKQTAEKDIMENAAKKIEDKMQMEIQPIPNHFVGKVQFSDEIVQGLNDYIDEIEDKQYSYADRLVGQLKNTDASSQVSFDLESDFGKEFKVIMEGVGSAYLQQGYKMKSISQLIDVWTNHAYEGDYNPIHDHGVPTAGGLSGFIWTKVPDSVKEGDGGYLNSASGLSDGCTHLVWGTRQRQDQDALFCRTEEYYQPKEGMMLIFPNWLKHQVYPFFGEGERRSVAMNWAIVDSLAQIESNLTPSEWNSFNEGLAKEREARIENNIPESTPMQSFIGGKMRWVRTDIFS